jgi:hypothetical protein
VPEEDAVSVEPVTEDEVAGPTIVPSDILTWRLARRVMVDHGYDIGSVQGRCRCCDEPWPCAAWRRADDITRQLQP